MQYSEGFDIMVNRRSCLEPINMCKLLCHGSFYVENDANVGYM